MDQEEPEPPHIKEEEEELWTSQEGEQLQGLEEADITEFPFTVKSEDDEEKPQSSQLHQTKEPQTGFNSLKMNEVPVREAGCDTGNKPSSCSECGKGYNQKSKPNMRSHTGEKPFSCSVCSKKFTRKAGLDTHLKTHTGEKPYSCPLCKKCFSLSAHLRLHIRTHTGEKPFSCNICNKRFTWPTQLKRHKCDESSQLHDLSTSQEGEQLEGTFTPVPERSQEEKEKLQSSQLHERQTELMKNKADGEDFGPPESASKSDPDRYLEPDTDGESEDPSEPETDHIGDWKETRKPHTCSNSHKENVLVNNNLSDSFTKFIKFYLENP
uniref:C2H2-type domain-containing protein n=1 Tax=Sparus aurata TaxID=8175 RepID=A0A671WYR6_SPAAU